jgi:hypothetical protein
MGREFFFLGGGLAAQQLVAVLVNKKYGYFGSNCVSTCINVFIILHDKQKNCVCCGE